METKPEITLGKFAFYYVIYPFVFVWRENLLKHGRAITKSYLAFVLLAFGLKTLFQNSLIYLSTMTSEWLLVNKILDVSTSWWNLEKQSINWDTEIVRA